MGQSTWTVSRFNRKKKTAEEEQDVAQQGGLEGDERQQQQQQKSEWSQLESAHKNNNKKSRRRITFLVYLQLNLSVRQCNAAHRHREIQRPPCEWMLGGRVVERG